MLKSWTTQEIKGLVIKGVVGRAKCPRHQGLSIDFKKRGAVWEWQGRVGGTPRTIRIGTWPDTGIAEARAKAAQINEDRALGVDVYVRHGVGEAAADKRTRRVLTCSDAWSEYLKRSENKPKTIAEKKTNWSCHWKEMIGDMLVTSVTFDDLADVIEDLRADDLPSAARVSTSYVKHFFGWCERNPRLTGLEASPAHRLVAGQSTPRKRYLSEREIAWFWGAACELHPVWRDYFLTLLLTGKRRNEIRLLARAEVNVSKRYLDIGEDRMKGGERHLVPVGDLAWKLIASNLDRTASPFVFDSPIRRGTAIGGLSKTMAKLREAIQRQASKDGVLVPHWTIHDLRRTFRTQAGNIRDADEDRVLPSEFIKHALAHRPDKLERTYDHSDFFRDKRTVYQTWEARLREIVGSEAFDIAVDEKDERLAA